MRQKRGFRPLKVMEGGKAANILQKEASSSIGFFFFWRRRVTTRLSFLSVIIISPPPPKKRIMGPKKKGEAKSSREPIVQALEQAMLARRTVEQRLQQQDLDIFNLETAYVQHANRLSSLIDPWKKSGKPNSAPTVHDFERIFSFTHHTSFDSVRGVDELQDCVKPEW